jgi:DMSO/TMAO reductase YedYZ molybdopterin-dependent catalytic subunit
VHNTHSNADEKYEGVPLAELLAKHGAPLGKDLRGPALALCVVATGSDGYRAVFSLVEIDASFHPGDVMVADTLNGKSLDNHSGPLKLVVTEDKKPVREVRNLVSLEVKPVY